MFLNPPFGFFCIRKGSLEYVVRWATHHQTRLVRQGAPHHLGSIISTEKSAQSMPDGNYPIYHVLDGIPFSIILLSEVVDSSTQPTDGEGRK